MAAKFGVQTPQIWIEWPELLRMWQYFDDSPFESAWTMDHLVPGRSQGESNGPCLEGWTLLAALAHATRRLRLGCMVTGVTYRHPVILAKIATTVDIISNGRLEFGIGAAWHDFEHRAYGIPFYTMKERQDRLEEALQVIQLLWTASAPVTFGGKYYQLQDAPFLPLPIQRPHPPIMVGGSGPRRTLRTAARYADTVNLWGPLEMVQQSLSTLHAHCRDVGRNPAEIRVTVFLPMANTTADNKAIVRRFLDAGFDDFIATPLAQPDFDALRRFAEEVVPAFQ